MPSFLPLPKLTGFNPQPLRRTAATRSTRVSGLPGSGFNPQPLRRTAATTMAVLEQRIPHTFQSSAAPKNGCYIRARRPRTRGRTRFNPQPLRRTAATRVRFHPWRSGSQCFNPQPLRRTAATSSYHAMPRPSRMFQSSAAPKNGCYCPRDTAADRLQAGFNPQPLRRTAAT